jgi:pyrroline-5-carboxylate reductase
MKIAILGAGNMGLSFSKSFLKYELIKPENLHLITRSQTKISKIAEEFPKSKTSTFEEVTELDADLLSLL